MFVRPPPTGVSPRGVPSAPPFIGKYSPRRPPAKPKVPELGVPGAGDRDDPERGDWSSPTSPGDKRCTPISVK